jgi:hypothetical protein
MARQQASFVKPILRLIVAALLAHALWRLGSAYHGHYAVRDGALDAARNVELSDDDLKALIVELAMAYDLALTEEHIEITRVPRHVIIAAAYKQPVQIFPGFRYPWPFSWRVDAQILITAAPVRKE